MNSRQTTQAVKATARNKNDGVANRLHLLDTGLHALARVGGLRALMAGLLLTQGAQAVSFIPTGSMTTPREFQTATRLLNGLVLVAGGDFDSPLSAELYNPATGTWALTGSLTTQRYHGTATLLGDGRVLVAGGFSASAELYDPATGTWAATGSMHTPRAYHTATLLPNGKVLIAGGYNGTIQLSSAELFDPATGQWTVTASMADTRDAHTATLLINGKVLAAAGFDGTNELSSAELYDPATGTWTRTGFMSQARSVHTATLLPSGNVLVAGGWLGGGSGSSAEVYDPAAQTWSTTGDLADARQYHTATLLTNGLVLVAGGLYGDPWSVYYSLSSAELYDPATGMWTAGTELNVARDGHTATLLTNGQVLMAGGESDIPPGDQPVASAELYDAALGNWVPVGEMPMLISDHTATLLSDGKVLVAGGFHFSPGGGDPEVSGAELYDPAQRIWTATGPLLTRRADHTATLLTNGQVLVAGGEETNYVFSSAELYEPATGTWISTGSLNAARVFHTATLLTNGQVLVTAGYDGTGALSSAELYDPITGTWTPTGELNVARENHTATLLSNGQVLVAGGDDGALAPSALSSAEVYDPISGTWTPVGDLQTARWAHTAVLLPTGNVLVAGGWDPNNSFNTILSSAELYNPSTGSWTTTGDLNSAREWHTATLLIDGQVLIAGGFGPVPGAGVGYLSASELYNSATGIWSLTGELNTARSVHTATLLPNGKVLAAGGVNPTVVGITTFSTELYDNQATPGAIPPAPVLTNLQFLLSGSFQFTFASSPGAVFNVFATTNLALPLSNWTLLGRSFELSPGLFQFSDTQATNFPQRFYSLRSL